ncbi:MAG: heparinase II/III family protein [Methylovirgula sp.]|jgi:uncharacterized heparinase superfamily protein
MTAKAPGRLAVAPQDIHHADPEIATQIYAGYFAFAGKVINTHGHLPFEIAPRDQNWEREFTSFGWLGHLRAANSALANANARAIANDFLLHAAKSEPSFEARVVTRRLLAFLSHAPMILEGADETFSRRFMRELAQTKILLEHEIAFGLAGEDRLFAAIALAEYDVCTRAKPGAQRKSTARLVRELDRQILPDGGHISRNPDTLIRLLLDLLPLRQAYVAQAVPVPDPLVNAIDRMLPMLRLLRHGDGTLALFNGMGFIAPDRLAALLAYDDVKAQALVNAPHSGYQRIECNGSTLIIDAGRVPPADFATCAHAGCLSIEFSVLNQKIIANCGTPSPRHPIARGPARVTAAHSTLTIDDTSSCHFAGSKGLEASFKDEILSGPVRVAIERQPMPKRVRIRLAHDGYVDRFGFVHERRLALSNDGLRLDGEDRVRPAAGLAAPKSRPYAIRFHIHPDARLEGVDKHSVLLVLPDGRRWIFKTADVPIAIEESISFATWHGPSPCDQLVIYSDTEQKERIAWCLRHFDEQVGLQERAAVKELALQD